MPASTFFVPFTPTGSGTGAIGKISVPRGVISKNVFLYGLVSQYGPSGTTGPQTTGQLWPMGQTLPGTHTHTNPALPTRQVVQFTTNAINPSAEDTGTVPLAVGYRIMRVITSVPARVRLYVSTAARTADAPRPAGQDPTGDHGLVAEVITTYSDLDWILTPLIDGYVASGSSAPWAVTNLSNSNSAVAVSLTWIATED